MALRTRNKISTTFNLASLADITFLLLIFFLLTSRIVSPSAIKVKRPTTSQQTSVVPAARITVDERLKYYVDNKPVSFGSLERILAQKLNTAKDRVLILDMDKSISIEKLVELFDIASDLEAELVLAADPKKKKRP